MDLVERYVHAVRFWLPRRQQDDVAAELGEDIHSEIEERERKEGHKLTELEIAALLQRRGRPMLVASRYRPQECLIGPALFPAYRFAIIIVALCYLVPWVLTWTGLAIFDPAYHVDLGRVFGPLWGAFWVDAFVTLGAVTAVFAVLERMEWKQKFLTDWDPRRLPAARDPNRIPRFNSTIELGANLAFCVCVAHMWPLTLWSQSGLRVTFAPVWKDFLWAFLLLAAANMAMAAIKLMQPYWTWPRASVQLALTAAAGATFCALCKANVLAEIAAPNLSAARAAQVVNAINTNVSRSFPFVVTGSAFIVVLSGVGRMVRMGFNRRRIMQRVAD